MIGWLVSNISTIIIALIIGAIVAAVIVKMVRDKKRGLSSCGCNCSACAMNGACHKK